MTAFWPTWIEGVFGFDPDGGNGTTEWWIVAVLAVTTIAAAALARVSRTAGSAEGFGDRVLVGAVGDFHSQVIGEELS